MTIWYRPGSKTMFAFVPYPMNFLARSLVSRGETITVGLE